MGEGDHEEHHFGQAEEEGSREVKCAHRGRKGQSSFEGTTEWLQIRRKHVENRLIHNLDRKYIK